VLVSILIGPYLRKFGAYTCPTSCRSDMRHSPLLGVIVLVCCSFTYVTAQIYAPADCSRFPHAVRVPCSPGSSVSCSARCWRHRAVTWTQIAQYIVLIVAYLVPIVILSPQHYGIPIPELTTAGDRAIGERETQR